MILCATTWDDSKSILPFTSLTSKMGITNSCEMLATTLENTQIYFTFVGTSDLIDYEPTMYSGCLML